MAAKRSTAQVNKKTAAAKTQADKPAPPKALEKSGRGSEVLGVLIAGFGIWGLYLALTSPESKVTEILRGLCGELLFLLPLIMIWIGLLMIFSGKYRKDTGRIALLAAMCLMVLGAFGLFVVEEVRLNTRIYIPGYVNNIVQTYNYMCRIDAHGNMRGGGAIGAILAVPLHNLFGQWGGLILLFVLMLADLVMLRIVSLRAIGDKLINLYREYREESSINRAEKSRQSAEAAERRHADAERAEAQRAKSRIERIPPVTTTDGDAPVPGLDPDQLDIPDYLIKGRRIPAKAGSANGKQASDSQTPPPTPVSPGSDDKNSFDLPDYNWSNAAPKADGDEDDRPPFDPDPAPNKPKPRRKQPAREEPEDISRRLDGSPIVIPKKADLFAGDFPDYQYPPISLLTVGTPMQARDLARRDQEKAARLEDTLKSFGIVAKLVGVAHGPAVTRFELSPAPGIKVSRITGLADNIALNLEAITVRIEAPIPGKAAVGVEVPNDEVEIVKLRDVLESQEVRRHPSRVAVALGKDNAGKYIVADLSRMPHVLIAGTTGAGKSVCVNCIICSILYRATPDEVRLILIDPKVVELSGYNGIPHLLVPVVTDPKKAAGALNWAVAEMTERYKKFADKGARDIKGYNLACGAEDKPMPQIVIVIDELSDLMMVAANDVEDSIRRLAQLARAAGIHLVIATQRPSVNVITGVIKANIPSRIAFKVASQVDSRTIIDVGGAEKLLGSGDMLFVLTGTKPQRVQGAWVSDDEIFSIVEFIKSRHEEDYSEDIIEHLNSQPEDEEDPPAPELGVDELLPQAIEIAVESGQASISMLQRKLRIGYARAGRLIDEMAERNIVSQAEGAKPRNVLITREEYQLKYK